jgi:hypothetical protein
MHILNHLNEGNDVTSVYEMKDALESHGVVRNTLTSIIDVDMTSQPKLSGQLKFPISQFNNFIFKDSGILTFKSYGFGEYLIPSDKLEVVTKTLMDTQDVMVNFYFNFHFSTEFQVPGLHVSKGLHDFSPTFCFSLYHFRSVLSF